MRIGIAVEQRGEPMADLIDRAAALDALARTAREKFNLSDEFNHYLAGLMDGDMAIRQMPSAQPEQRWIPCKVRLPEESGTYIVTAYDGTNKRVTFVKYQKTLKRWDLTGARAYWRILAYKPLPEPWRGE